MAHSEAQRGDHTITVIVIRIKNLKAIYLLENHVIAHKTRNIKHITRTLADDVIYAGFEYHKIKYQN